jgi:hypothetical protein
MAMLIGLIDVVYCIDVLKNESNSNNRVHSDAPEGGA